MLQQDMNKGTLFRAHAVKNVFGGDSIVRVAGVVVFTPGVIAGEDYVGRVVSTSKDYVRAEVVEILKASPERCSSKCSPSGRCPGCVYSFMSHAEEQRQKLGQLRDFMRQMNKLFSVRTADAGTTSTPNLINLLQTSRDMN